MLGRCPQDGTAGAIGLRVGTVEAREGFRWGVAHGMPSPPSPERVQGTLSRRRCTQPLSARDRITGLLHRCCSGLPGGLTALAAGFGAVMR